MSLDFVLNVLVDGPMGVCMMADQFGWFYRLCGLKYALRLDVANALGVPASQVIVDSVECEGGNTTQVSTQVSIRNMQQICPPLNCFDRNKNISMCQQE